MVSDKNSSQVQMWNKLIQKNLDEQTQFYQPGEKYIKIAEESLVGIYTCIYVKKMIEPHLKNFATSTNKLGVGGKTGNKGGVAVRF